MIKKIVKDYLEWRSFRVPVIQAIRLSFKINVLGRL